MSHVFDDTPTTENDAVSSSAAGPELLYNLSYSLKTPRLQPLHNVNQFINQLIDYYSAIEYKYDLRKDSFIGGIFGDSVIANFLL